MLKQNRFFTFLLSFLLSFFLIGCSSFKKVEREITTGESFQKIKRGGLELMKQDSPYMKVHMKNGHLYVLHNWTSDDNRQIVSGQGWLLNENRDSLANGIFNIGIDSVSIVETNKITNSGTMTAITIFTSITAAVTMTCIANPKACFGSCPTFYVPDSDGFHLRAEGFSSSISPSMEASDVDALNRESSGKKEFSIVMKNEALETHVVRSVDLIAVPKEKNTKVFVDQEGAFWNSDNVISPLTATAPEGNVLKNLMAFDGNERFSKADSTYLGEKEVIELEFNSVSAQTGGLVIGCRQTLLSTYLLYQAFAYMGNKVGYWFSQLENDKLKRNNGTVEKIMGGIEILRQNSKGEWKKFAEISEQGPLATDIHIIPLELLNSKTNKIRLRMSKGNWRIDYVALALNLKKTGGVLIHPNVIIKEGVIDESAKEKLVNSKKVLTTLPGDEYTIKYNLPNESSTYELFLESRGYYLEWIRKEWIQEENPFYLAQLFYSPEQALRRLAPEYKQLEETMESSFWRSRYAKP